MRLIAITKEHFFDGEAEMLQTLLGQGFWRIHLRKPQAGAEALEAFLRQIPPRFYHAISLHDHFATAARLKLGGVHLNSRNPTPPEGWTGLVSRSCHSIDEIAIYAPRCDYMFLSPIFDSISKPGYLSACNLDQLQKSGMLSAKVFALGGVTPQRLPQLEAAGFGGAAMLGSAWASNPDSHITASQ